MYLLAQSLKCVNWMGGFRRIKDLTLDLYAHGYIKEHFHGALLCRTVMIKKKVVCFLISQDNDSSMGSTAMRCEVATFPIRFGKLSPPLFCYFSSSAAAPWLGMQRQCGSPCSLFSCQSPLCTKMLIGPNPPLEAVLVAWPRTLKDTLVWNTKEPIQVPEKRGTEHSNTIQFPSWKRGELEGRRVRAGMKMGRIIVLIIN